MVRVSFYSMMILFLLVCSCTPKTVDKTDTANNDSIKKYLDLAANDTLDAKLRNKYNDKAFSLLDLSRNDTLTRWYLYIIGINNSNLLRFKNLEKNAKILNYLSNKSNSQLGIAYANKLKGLDYMFKSENENAINAFYISKKIFLKRDANKSLIRINKDIADIQTYSCDFLGSNKTLFENLKLMKTLNINSDIDFYRNYYLIANNFFWLKNYNSSIVFEKKAIKHVEKNPFYTNYSYLSLAHSYLEIKNYDRSLYYVNKILNNPDSKFIRPQTFYSAKSVLGQINLLQNKMDKLPGILYEVEDFFSKNDDSGGQDYNQINLSEYYIKVKDTLNAIRAAQKAVVLSKSYKNPTEILLSLNQLIKVDKANASVNAQEYIRINDSLQIAERSFRDKFANIVYETDEIKQEKETAIKQKWIIGGMSVVVILIITLLLIITRQHSKQKELQFLQSQQKANEEIYDLMLNQKNKEDLARQNEKKRIALELHDGVMNKLASTRLNLNVLSHKKDEQTIEKCLTHVEGIYKIEQEIRRISHNLNQDIFKGSNSFISMLDEFVATQNDTTTTQYQIEIDETINWGNISSSIKMNFYRIIQEASHNINKFAQAKKAMISLLIDEDFLCLSITDDGKGFDTEKQTEGIGLKNIQQRVETLNGKFVIQSKNNKSTSLNISIPLK